MCIFPSSLSNFKTDCIKQYAYNRMSRTVKYKHGMQQKVGTPLYLIEKMMPSDCEILGTNEKNQNC